MKKIQYYLEFISLKLFMSFIQLIGITFAKKVAFLLAKIIFIFIPIRRRHIIDSLTKSFPNKTKQEILEIAKDVYKQFACTIIEMIFVGKMTSEEIKEFVNFENIYLIKKAIDIGKGCIFLSAHYSNWEMLAISFGNRWPVSIIVAKQKNPYFDKLIDSIRSNKGYKTIYKDKAPIGVMRALKKKEFIGILADQNAGENGVVTNFFNRPVYNPKGPAIFALRSGCPLFVAFSVRQPNGKYIARFEEIEKPNTGNEEEDIKIIMTKYNELLEKNIIEHPSYWFWFHRRWKVK